MVCCKIGYSPHADEYENLRFDGHKTLEEIVEYADRTYNETFSTMTLSRHFHHTERYIKTIKDNSVIRNKKIEAEIKRDIQAAQTLTKNLEICSDMIKQHVDQLRESGEFDSKSESSLRGWLAEVRQTIELALKWSKEINKDTTKAEQEYDVLMRRVSKALEVLPQEMQSLFLKELEKPEDETVNIT